MFEDYTCEVEDVFDDVICVIYRHGGWPEDAVGVSIPVPDDLDLVTVEWMHEQMAGYCGQAFLMWQSLQRAKDFAKHKTTLRDRLGKSLMAGQFDTSPAVPEQPLKGEPRDV